MNCGAISRSLQLVYGKLKYLGVVGKEEKRRREEAENGRKCSSDVKEAIPSTG